MVFNTRKRLLRRTITDRNFRPTIIGNINDEQLNALNHLEKFENEDNQKRGQGLCM